MDDNNEEKIYRIILQTCEKKISRAILIGNILSVYITKNNFFNEKRSVRMAQVRNNWFYFAKLISDYYKSIGYVCKYNKNLLRINIIKK